MACKHFNWLLVLVKMRHLYFTERIWQICNMSQEQEQQQEQQQQQQQQQQQLFQLIDRDARGENTCT